MLPGSYVSYLYKFIIYLSVIGKCFSETSNVSETGEDFVPVPRVVNGWPGKLGDVPYQVAFKSEVNHKPPMYKTFCGGTIVAPNKIISAAHCFAEDVSECMRLFTRFGYINQKDLNNKYAVAGTLKNLGVKPATDDTDEGQYRELLEAHFPRKFKFPQRDIAIVFTTTPFTFNNNVNSIPYASRYADYRGKCLVSGYGRISTTAKLHSDKLLLAHLEIVPIYICNIQYRKNMEKFICTSSIMTDVGKGDSGGPLVCMNTGDPNEKGKGVLVGVVSGHHQKIGSFFTRVSSFYKYIEKNRSCNNGGNFLIIVLFVLIEYPLLPF